MGGEKSRFTNSHIVCMYVVKAKIGEGEGKIRLYHIN